MDAHGLRVQSSQGAAARGAPVRVPVDRGGQGFLPVGHADRPERAAALGVPVGAVQDGGTARPEAPRARRTPVPSTTHWMKRSAWRREGSLMPCRRTWKKEGLTAVHLLSCIIFFRDDRTKRKFPKNAYYLSSCESPMDPLKGTWLSQPAHASLQDARHKDAFLGTTPGSRRLLRTGLPNLQKVSKKCVLLSYRLVELFH